MRKKEYIKKSEARILRYLMQVNNHLKDGRAISNKLKIDYIYVMKLLRAMYNKGWVKVHKFNEITFFEVTLSAPTEKTKEILTQAQTKIKEVYGKLRA